MINDILSIVELEPGLGPQYLLADETFATDTTVSASTMTISSGDAGIMPVSIEIDPMETISEAPTNYYNALR